MPDILTSITAGGLTLGSYLITTAAALLCGVLAAFAAAFRHRTSGGFLASLILLPVIVENVILMVNGNVGTGVAVMGAFSLVRFRSVAGRAREIVFIFLAMTTGLAAAGGFVGMALLLTLLVVGISLLLSFLPQTGRREQELRITVPESLHFSNAFEDLFDTYTASHRLLTVKTSNMGSLYKLHYRVVLKSGDKAKELIDALRCRNGNLEIALSEAPESEAEL